MSSRRFAVGLSIALCAAQVSLAQAPELVRPNDNRARAGVQGGNAFAVRMEAKLALWYPDGDDKPGMLIPAFAELGRAPQVPGPLIRAPGGSDIIVMVRNSIPGVTLTVHGLHPRPAIAPVGQTFSDSVVIASGTFQTLRFKLDRPGTYYYWATTTGRSFANRTHEDAMLSGAIVVDEPGERTPRDRILVLGQMSDTAWSDSTRHRGRSIAVINGRAWPASDRIQYERGEIVRWRVINTSTDVHPMHLHGGYFRVTRRGDGMEDTSLATRTELIHTERMAPGGTVSATFTAERLGTWLFQCEDPTHGSARAMGGLAAAMEITYAEDDTTWKLPRPEPPYPVRRYRMVLRPNVGSTQAAPLYGIGLSELGVETPQVDSGSRVGPTLQLNRAEPVSVWVVNNLPEPTSITWHGVEGESIYDGVPGVSGFKPPPIPQPRNAPPRPVVANPPLLFAPLIAPGDSFEVRLQPPRSGTFAYHAIVNEARQMSAGIVGAIIVSDKGKYDASLNVPIVVSSPSDSATEEVAVLVNGATTPQPVDLRRGPAYRIRAMNFTAGRPDLVFEIRQIDSTFAAWRPAARDGIELPAAERASVPARAMISNGQIRDYEFQPIRLGDYRLEIRTRSGQLLGVQPIRVY